MIEYLPEIVQTFIIIVAIVGSVKHGEKRITAVETKVEHLEEAVKPIPGISRKLAHLEGQRDK